MTLRELRMWHWGFVVSNRRSARAAEQKLAQTADRDRIKRAYYIGQVTNYHNKANFHLKAVQALNDVVDGTAEADFAATAQKDEGTK